MSRARASTTTGSSSRCRRDGETEGVEDGGGWWRLVEVCSAAGRSDFLIVGPARDPAGLRGLSDPVAAFRKVAERRGIFVSRGDQSGTHQREQLLWKRAGFPSPPRGEWYIESGQGMGATLQLADEKQGCTLP